MHNLRPFLSATAFLFTASFAFSAQIFSGADAVQKIQNSIPGTNLTQMGINSLTAKWTTLTNGVEYSFMQFSNLYGCPDDVHLLRIDYKNANVKMKLVQNATLNGGTYSSSLTRTSVAAKNNGAIFGINGSFYSTSKTPYQSSYFLKANGVVYPSDYTGASGLAFNNDAEKTFSVNTGLAGQAANWENIIGGDYVLHNGRCSLEGSSWATAATSAGYPILGSTPDGVIYIAVIDGRRAGISKGITYYNSYRFLLACGCTEGVCLDGGGSTTLVIRDDYVPSSDFAYTQFQPSYATGMTIMNYVSSDGSTRSERAVLNQILFLPGDVAEVTDDDGEGQGEGEGEGEGEEVVPPATDPTNPPTEPAEPTEPPATEPEEPTNPQTEPDYSSGFLAYLRTGGAATSGQRVILDYTPCGDTIVRAAFSPNVVDANNQCLYCARAKAAADNASFNYNYFVAVSKKARYDYYNKQQDTGETMVAGTDYSIFIDRNTGYLYKGESTSPRKTGLTYTSFTAGGPMALFMSYVPANGVLGTWANAANVTFYNMRVSEPAAGTNEEVKVDLVPRRINDVVGLYDIIGDTFYPAEGTGAFTADEGADLDASKILLVRGETKAFYNPVMAPGYGLYTNNDANAEIAVSASGDWQEFSAVERGRMTGWKLTQNGATVDKPLAFTYSHNGYAELQSVWELQYLIEARSSDTGRGTVTGGGWYADGATVTLTAVPAAGGSFYGWVGDIGDADASAPTITVPADRARSVVATFSRTIFVATTGDDSSANPYSISTPLKTVDKALTTAVDGDAIYIAAGAYKESKTWTITKAITISGEGSDKTIIQGCKIQLNNANLVIQDLRVTGYSSGGTVTFVQNGAGGTMRRCDISGNTRTSTNGTGVQMYCGNLIDCTITNNVNGGGGNGVGINISASGDCLLENCLIADNMVGGSTSGVGGLYIASSVNGRRVILRHCTIVGNTGGDAGGLSVNGNVNFEMTDCLVADNIKLKAATASNTADAYLGWANGYTRGVTNSLIAKCPTYNAKYEVENCITNIAAGLNQPYAGDYSVGRGSAAWGAASDGTDIGFYQTEHGDAFAVGCYAETDRGVGSVTTILHGTAVNAAGAVAYEWDLDGDGTYETSGATVEATFAEIGWNGVNVKATCGGESVEATVGHVVCVFAPTTYCWTKSPNPTFPYATWETAATDPYAALAATINGGKLQFTNEMVLLTKPMQVTRRIEMCGTGKENNSVNSSPLYWSLKNFEDVNATGTSIQRKGAASDVILLRLFNEGATVHSIAYGPGRSRDLEIYGESVISNCTVRYGSYTSGDGCGVWMNAGLVTHCVISNNYCSNDSTKGVQLHMEGTAKLRNSLVINGRADSAGSNGGCKGAIWASGSNVQIENCTICGNTAGRGGGVYTVGAVTVRNCIIRDNSAMLTDNDIFVESGTPVFENCCLAENRGTGCQTGLPGFIIDDSGRNTWTFGAASPCVNNGAVVAWATEDATDYFGNKRVQGEVIDIGCFEADLSQATCDIEVSAAEIIGGASDVTFSVKLVGATLPEDAVCKWDFDGDGVYEREGASVTLRCEEGYHTASLKVMNGDETLYEVEGKSDLVTVFPTVIYFNVANAENAAFPYNTPATAAAKMSDVLAAARSGVDIRVCEGVHNCDAQILLNFKCTLRAAEGVTARPRLVRKFEGNSFVSVAHDEALVEGLDLDDNKYYTFNVNLNAGTIRDCVIRNGNYTSGSGIGLTMNGGLVDRCEIVGTRGTATADYSSRGLALRLSGVAVVRNSLIRGNYADDSTKGRRGGLISVEGNAVLESCTITGNTNRQENVVCTFGTGTVRNCIIYGNECGQNNAFGSPYFPSYAPLKTGTNNALLLDDGEKTAAFDYNCYEVASGDAYGEHDILANPCFRNAIEGNYEITPASPCKGTGLNLPWMDEAADLMGNPRKHGARVDIGAIENQQSRATTLIVR